MQLFLIDHFQWSTDMIDIGSNRFLFPYARLRPPQLLICCLFRSPQHRACCPSVYSRRESDLLLSPFPLLSRSIWLGERVCRMERRDGREYLAGKVSRWEGGRRSQWSDCHRSISWIIEGRSGHRTHFAFLAFFNYSFYEGILKGRLNNLWWIRG